MREISETEIEDGVVRVEVLAHLFGVTVRRVQQITQEGIIKTTDAKSNGRTCRRYPLAPAISNYIQHLSEKANGRGKTDKEVELREQKLEADIALRESQGELHRLKTAIATGDYVSIEEVQMDYEKFFLVFKKFATSLPSRMMSMIAADLDPAESRRVEKELTNEVRNLLDTFVVAGVTDPEELNKRGSKKKKNSNS